MEDYSVEHVLEKGKLKGTPLFAVPRDYLFTIAGGQYPDHLFSQWVRDNFEAILEKQKQVAEAHEDREKSDCQKVKYIDKKTAVSHLNWIRENSKSTLLPVRAYECDRCTAWHLASQNSQEQQP